MTGTEVATMEMDDETRRRILAMSGQVISGSKNYIPKVKVNKVVEDRETGKDLPVGVVAFNSKKHDKWVYAKRKTPVKFVPFVHKMRYIAYDAKAEKTVGRSILFSDWGEEILASNGKLKAGKGNSPEHIQVKCKHCTYGLISFSGVDAEGNELEVENEPVLFQTGGKAFIEFGDMMKEMRGKILAQYEMDVEVVSRGEGIYTIELTFKDLTNQLPFTPAAMEALEQFSAFISAENEIIEKQHNRIVHKQEPESDGDVVDSDDDDDLADDFEDAEYEEVAE